MANCATAHVCDFVVGFAAVVMNASVLVVDVVENGRVAEVLAVKTTEAGVVMAPYLA
jgi:hypothetical protein